MEEPLISVVMPIYNAGPYLIDALASLLEQTFSRWEMLCVNDGSTDESPHILNWFASQDSRIRVLHQPNQGIVAALNLGCKQATAPWIGRMDADDVAFPDRLEKQFAYVEKHPQCVALGGAILEMDSNSRPLGIQTLPTEHDAIVKRLMTRRTGLFHPTTLIQREAFRKVGGYRLEYQWIEDHDLWLRLANVGLLANLQETLLCYRLHASSVCWKRRKIQSERMDQLLTMQSSHPPQNEHAPAGPGKWARTAMRGGYPLVALNHLGQLFREQGPNRYSIRMTLELALRFVPSLLKSWTGSQPAVPDYSSWRNRLEQRLERDCSRVA